MNNNKEKNPTKEIKTLKFWVAIITVIAAVLLILTIVFGTEYGHYKHEVNKDQDQTLVAINLDVDGDGVSDYTYNLTGSFFGKSFYDVTSDSSLMDNQLTFSYSSSTMGHFLNKIAFAFNIKGISSMEGSTASDGKSGTYLEFGTYKNNKFSSLDYGVDGAIMNTSNSYMFSLASWKM